MGKFFDTTYSNTVEGVTDFNKSLIQNDFYHFNSQGRGTRVTYYHINKEKSTLDQGSRLAYADSGSDSPLRFDVIRNLYLYQFNRHEVNFNNDEFGLESAEISGESYIIPEYNLEPLDGDFFTVDHADEKFLYQVVDVDRDTLANRANVWKISWKIAKTTDISVLKNIADDYTAVDVVNGTEINPIVLTTDYNFALEIEHVANNLVSYFRDLFYSDYIQSFTYKWYTEYRMYDPYSIEFIIRNNLLNNANDEYMYIDHKTKLPSTFSIDYNRSVWKCIEDKNKNKLFSCNHKAQADLIEDPISIFATRYEQYFKLYYEINHEPNGPFNPRAVIPIMDEELIERIIRKKYYDDENKDIRYKNIFIKYFNKEKLTKKDLESIEYIDFEPVNSIYYETLFLIYILFSYEKQLLS